MPGLKTPLYRDISRSQTNGVEIARAVAIWEIFVTGLQIQHIV